MNSRLIAHLDLDAFFCAVEERRRPQLRGRPFAVGGRPEQRGVVASCSYPARACGVRSAMPMARALRLCPQLRVLPPDFFAYRRASQAVMARIRARTERVEQISIDEAFFDLSPYGPQAEAAARALQAEIRRELRLPNSIGLASNKLVAKIANSVGKAAARASGQPPNAFTLVPPGEEAAFLAPLPVEMLWGIGPKTAARLAALDIRTIGQLAAQNEVDMLRRFGQVGYDLVLRARGIDARPLTTVREARYISTETTFPHDLTSRARLLAVLRRQAAQVSARLVKAGLTARTVKVKLRYANFDTRTRQETLPAPVHEAEIITRTAERIFLRAWESPRPLRLLGVGLSGLEKTVQQITLWERDWEKERRLDEALRKLQARYGQEALRRGFTPKTDRKKSA